MALKRTLYRFCDRCGQEQLKFQGDRVWLWHKCPRPIPGPSAPPHDFRVADVLIEERAESSKGATRGLTP